MKITKHFVTVGKRRVHYLRAGSGPALAMLHASPCSAKVMRPLLPVFGERFTCLAFDTPGFGLSDKLAMPKPRIEDFADALAETLAALGVEQVATYGRHTRSSSPPATRSVARWRSPTATQRSPNPTPMSSSNVILSR